MRLIGLNFRLVGPLIRNQWADLAGANFATRRGAPRFSRRSPPRPHVDVLYRKLRNNPRTEVYSPASGVGV